MNISIYSVLNAYILISEQPICIAVSASVLFLEGFSSSGLSINIFAVLSLYPESHPYSGGMRGCVEVCHVVTRMTHFFLLSYYKTVGDTQSDTLLALFVTLMSGILGLSEKWDGGGDTHVGLGVGMAFNPCADWQY